MGAADSNDANLQPLLAQLKIKGWLDKQAAKTFYEQQRYILVAFQGEVGGTTPDIDRRTMIVNAMTAQLLSQYPSRQIHPTTPAASDPPPILTVTINVQGTTLSPCTYGAFRNIWKCPAQTTIAVSASLPQGWQFDKTYTYANGTSGVGWGTPRTPLTEGQINSWISQDVTGLFKEILDADEVHMALGNFNPEPTEPNAHSSAPKSERAPEQVTPAVHSFFPTGNPIAQSAAPAQQHSTLIDNSNPQPAPQQAGTTRAPGAPAPSMPADRSTIDPPSSQPASSTRPTTAILHLYRLSHMGGAFSQYEIEIDGRRVAKIANAQSVRMDLSPGKHNINVTYRAVKSDRPLYDLELEPGKEYWIRVDLSDGLIVHMRLAVVPEAEARDGSGKLKEIANGDLQGK